MSRNVWEANTGEEKTMGDSFGARARRFMGWVPAEDLELDAEVFEQAEEPEEIAPVTELAPVERSFVSPIHRETREEAPATEPTRIVTVHPEAYADALVIGEHFREGTPVIMNLTDTSEDEARRIIDFAGGLAFGLHGTLEKVTNRVFLLSPQAFEVIGEAQRSRRTTLLS